MKQFTVMVALLLVSAVSVAQEELVTTASGTGDNRVAACEAAVRSAGIDWHKIKASNQGATVKVSPCQCDSTEGGYQCGVAIYYVKK